MPGVVNTVFPDTIVQTCVVHLIRNSFRYSSKKYWAEIAKDLKAIYQAVSPAAHPAAILARLLPHFRQSCRTFFRSFLTLSSGHAAI